MAKKEEQVNKFSKSQLVNSKRYKEDIDIVNALLKEDKEYTIDEVDKIINDFKKGKVK